MTKLLILDKDGTITTPKSGAKFVQSPSDQVLLPGVKEAIDRYAWDGWKMAIASNQGGVAVGRKTLREAIEEMQYCMNLIPKIEYGFMCPDLEGSTYYEIWRLQTGDEEWLWIEAQVSSRTYPNFRKPECGMLVRAMDVHDPRMLPQNVLYVGDRPEDEGAALAAGVEFMWADKWRAGA
ncbi:HAD hydrolase-like protein [Leptolyngbya sp. FACHB-16]|uniref:HAD hydrolase-like protein n=1 Tax=unclassified Leptolyngbya TaxID=2650499 RepID=UPI001682219B|nr:HAD hydrolase-like protein [Leptolyngbya sp. FACHB-16]MBD2153148.1 HAD hydrolase-like protein [Leptolyngbya sp. FACHB-16]